MSWPSSLTVGALTAVIAGFVAGLVASLCVGWYRMSSFEGASGYFVVFMALLGAAAGLLVGIATCRLLADPSFLKCLGAAVGIVTLLAGAVAGIARLRADVPPTLDGHELVLAIELKWPAGRNPAEIAETTNWLVRLSALSGRTARVSQEGPLFREDARLDDGRWVVPGAVDVFTSRGKRMISFGPDSLVGEGFEVPLPGRPGKAQLEWSEWLPLNRGGGDTFQYRFKVIPDNAPFRLERVGPFEVASLGGGFSLLSYDGGAMQWSGGAHFEVRHNGTAMTIDDPNDSSTTLVNAVATVGGQPALVVQVNAPYGEGQYVLLAAHGDSVRQVPIAIGGTGVRADPITADTTLYLAARNRQVPRGRIDRELLAVPGAYLFRDAILDTRTLTVRHFSTADGSSLIDRIPPLALSPDGLGLVRLAFTGEGDATELAVLDLDGGETRTVPIDRTVMRYAELEQIDPAWLEHYFTWQRDAAGRDRLVARQGVVPLPYRGTLTLDNSGYREYRLAPAGPGLRPAFEEWLASEFHATLGDTAADAFSHEVTIDGAVVHVSYSADDGHVGVWMDRGTDTKLVATIAERFDAALRGGRFDGVFGR